MAGRGEGMHPTPVKKGRRTWLGRAALVAGLIHVQLLALIAVFAFLRAPRNVDLARADAEDAVTVTSVDEETARAISAELDRKPPPEPEQKPEEKPPEEPRKP